MPWEKVPVFLKSHSCSKNKRFRVPIHSATNRFTLEKFPPPPQLLTVGSPHGPETKWYRRKSPGLWLDLLPKNNPKYIETPSRLSLPSQISRYSSFIDILYRRKLIDILYESKFIEILYESLL